MAATAQGERTAASEAECLAFHIEQFCISLNE